MQANQSPPMGVTPKFPTQNVQSQPNTLAQGQGQINPQQRQGMLSQLANMKQQALLLQQQAASQGGQGGGGNPATMGAAPANADQVPLPIPSGGILNNPYTNTGAPPFSQAVGTLASQSSQPTQGFNQAQQTAQQAAAGEQNMASQSSPEYQAALKQYADANAQLQQTRADYATQTKLVQGGRTNLSEAGGQQGLLNNAFNQQQASFAQQMDAAARAAGIATGQQQAQQQGFQGAGSTANTMGGIATGQQQAQQQGLYQSAGLLRPDLGQYGQAQYSPIGGLLNGGGQGSDSLNPINNIQSIAQQVINGQISPEQAYAMGGSVPNFQGALNAAIQQAKPGFNAASASGQFAANQANTQTRGVTPTNAAASLYGQTYPEVAQIQQTTANIDQFGNLLLSNMKDLNPTQFAAGNQLIKDFRSALTSPQQAQFDTTFVQLKAQIASLLQSGGAQIPTQVTSDSNSIINGTAPIKTLQDTIDRIKAEGTILTRNLQAKLNTAGATIGAPKAGSQGGDYQAYLKAIGQ